MSQQRLTDREQASEVELNAQIHVVQDGVSQRATIEQVKDALDIPESTTDVPEGTNLYYTDARVAANSAVASNTTHRGRNDNPHGVTKEQVGLGNVDNTSDADKPISNATQSALNDKVSTASNLGTGEGVFGAKVGADLRFKSIKAGDNVTLSSDSDEITVNAEQADVSNFETTTELNARDTANRDRTNHTGEQAISTVTNLQTELDGKAPTSHTHTASQVTDFDTAVEANSAVQANTAKRSYPIADEKKLATIEEGAEVNTLNDVIAGTNVTIDKTDPLNPVISSTATEGGSFTVASAEEINTGEDNEKGVTPQGLRDSLYPRVYRQAEEPTLADGDVWVNTGEEEVDTPAGEGGQTEEFDNGNSGTAVTIDWNNGVHQKLTLTDDCAITFTDPEFLGRYDLRIVQDNTGEHDLTIPNNVVFEGNEPTWTDMLDGEQRILTFSYRGDFYVCSVSAIFNEPS